jgi:hypothetical protein
MSDLPKQITFHDVLVRNPNVFLREENKKGGILFDPDTGSVRVLNITAAETWKLLDAPRSLAQIIRALKEKFDGLDAAAEDKVLELVQRFVSVGAVFISAEHTA